MLDMPTAAMLQALGRGHYSSGTVEEVNRELHTYSRDEGTGNLVIPCRSWIDCVNWRSMFLCLAECFVALYSGQIDDSIFFFSDGPDPG